MQRATEGVLKMMTDDVVAAHRYGALSALRFALAMVDEPGQALSLVRLRINACIKYTEQVLEGDPDPPQVIEPLPQEGRAL